MASYASKSDITFLIGKIKTALSGKVDSVSGKGLSTNDYTAADKAIVDAAVTTTSISGYGYQTESNVKTTVEGYGYQTAANVKSTVEGYGYQTASDVSTAINNAIGDMTGISYEVVTSLPTTGVVGKIYLIADTHSDSNDAYDEYIWVDSQNKFEKIGNTDADLSGYLKTTDVTEIGTTEMTTLWNA